MNSRKQKQLVALLLVLVMLIAGTGAAMAKPASAGNGSSWKSVGASATPVRVTSADSNGKAFGKTSNDAKARALYDLNLFKGTSNTAFVAELARGATRMEAITLIGRALKWDAEEGFNSSSVPLPADVQAFLDEKPGDASRLEMANHVRYALAHGVTMGIGRGNFGVDMPVNARMMYTWYARALLHEEDVWNNPEVLAQLGMMNQERIRAMNWDEFANRDALVGIMYESMNWRIRGTNMKLVQRMLKHMWFDYKAAVRAGLMDPEETDMSYVVRQLDMDKLQLTFSHVLNEAAAETGTNYTIRVQHRPYGTVEIVSGGAIVVTGGGITVAGTLVDPDDYTADLSEDGNDVVLTFEEDFLVGDKVFITPSQNIVSRFDGYTLDERRDTRLLVIR